MSEQLIIALSREFGSGGHEIARALADRFDLPLYEKNMLEHIAQSQGIDTSKLERYDELPKNHFIYRTVNGFSNAPGDAIAQMQFKYLREQAAAGNSFLVVGRCADEILKAYPNLITIFVRADLPFKTERTMLRGPVAKEEALALIFWMDRKRRAYHNQYCKAKWGSARNYDLTVNSAKLDIEGTSDILEAYIRARIRRNSTPLSEPPSTAP